MQRASMMRAFTDSTANGKHVPCVDADTVEAGRETVAR